MKNLISLAVALFLTISPALALTKEQIINGLVAERDTVELAASFNFTIGNLISDAEAEAFHKSDSKMGDSLYDISMKQINLLMSLDAEIARLGGDYKFKGIDDCIRVIQEDSLSLIEQLKQAQQNAGQ